MSMRKHAFSATESLQTALSNIGLEKDAERIFDAWPALRTVSLQYCRYVSPFIELETGESLLELTMADAINSFKMYEATEQRKGIQAFIAEFPKRVVDLCGVRLSVQTEEGGWVIWQYDQPVLDWMAIHGRKAVQIRRREDPFEKGPVLVKLLSYICSVRDLQMADMDLVRFI